LKNKMADNKCDYCEKIGETFCCLAYDNSDLPYNRLNVQDKMNWAEDFTPCESNFYRGCKKYLEKLTSSKLDKPSSYSKFINERLDNLKLGDEFS